MEDELFDPLKAFTQLKSAAVAKVKYYVDLGNKKLKINLPMPRVVFDTHGTTAGWANYGENKIRLNPTLLRENGEEFINEVCSHEVGHLLTHEKYGKTRRIKPHGTEWQAVMWHLGLPAKRCHSYDVSNVPTMRGRIAKAKARSEGPKTYKSDIGTVHPIGIGRIIELD